MKRDKAKLLASGKRTLDLEIEGLHALRESLNGGFESAVETLAGIEGRVIVTGVGKSGHIGRKIAATLASTGTPALFVHAGEAAHGDLGMITPADAILALSWSGETAELKALTAYSRRFGIKLIAMTARKESALGRAADVLFQLPQAKEAAAMGLAPTTSSVIQLGAGDALAVALLERQGFTADRFKDLHPAGALGAQLKTAGEIMHKGDTLPLCDLETGMEEVLLVMSGKGFGCAGVVDKKGALCGIITDGDLRRHMGEALLKRSAREVMTPRPKTIKRDTLAAAALGVMEKGRITALFIVEKKKPVGLLHIHDFLRLGTL